MNLTHIFILIFIFLFSSSTAALFSKIQSTAVKGFLTCDGEAAKNVKLQLWDINLITSNDLMAEATPDSEGKFTIQGSEKGFTTIDPLLRIFHKCFKTLGKCYKKVDLVIPDEFVSKGKIPNKIFDIGHLELKELISQDTKDCLQSSSFQQRYRWKRYKIDQKEICVIVVDYAKLHQDVEKVTKKKVKCRPLPKSTPPGPQPLAELTTTTETEEPHDDYGNGKEFNVFALIFSFFIAALMCFQF